MIKEEKEPKYNYLKELSTVELAQLLNMTNNFNDADLRHAILLEFKERSKDGTK
jgi:hypothetical protein